MTQILTKAVISDQKSETTTTCTQGFKDSDTHHTCTKKIVNTINWTAQKPEPQWQNKKNWANLIAEHLTHHAVAQYNLPNLNNFQYFARRGGKQLNTDFFSGIANDKLWLENSPDPWDIWYWPSKPCILQWWPNVCLLQFRWKWNHWSSWSPYTIMQI